jgi:hypothetical protein
MPRSLLLLTVVFALTASPSPAASGVPSAANSTVPPCLVACPFGDVSFDVVVRDLANNPIVNSTVVLDFSRCPQAYLCTVPGQAPDPYVVDLTTRTIRMATDANGLAHFPLRVGGVGAAGQVWVLADGVLLAQRALASPDQDGNGFVTWYILQDYTLFASKLGTTDPTADFDCNGVVDAADENLFFQHDSHACEGWVDAARRATWGRLKAHYR